jgi:hypothetical protein
MLVILATIMVRIVLECWDFNKRLVSRNTDVTFQFVVCSFSEFDCIKSLGSKRIPGDENVYSCIIM